MVLKTIETDFVKLNFYERFVIAELSEGIDIDENIVDILIQYSIEFYGDNPFGYISNRINSYSINPVIYFKLSKIKNLVAFAVVSTRMIVSYNVQIEKAFMSKPFELFDNLDEAVNWVNQLVNNHC
ncbi:MAG: hypothetical protein CO119_09425 [Flavobacteriales bacterium CG_4_9_14_3_um_filter_40_17]|nr:MAG: hypothetical protein CO119_09425 [Flavobacteriales bacterium CG_4_9_14_3_um_filter_40_17]